MMSLHAPAKAPHRLRHLCSGVSALAPGQGASATLLRTAVYSVYPLIAQTPFKDFGADEADPSVMTERDVQKLAKRAEKEEMAQRAAFAAFQVRMPRVQSQGYEVRFG